MKHLRSLVLENECVPRRNREWLRYMLAFVRHYVLMFPKLGHLAIVTDWPEAPQEILKARRNERRDLVKALNQALGLKGHRVWYDLRPGRLGKSLRFDHWEWKVKPGQALTWTSEREFRSIPWKHIGIVYQHLAGYHRYAFWRTYGTAYLGVMCRRLAWVCRAGDDCPCAGLPPPPYCCGHPNPHPAGFSCHIAPNGLDSFGVYTFRALVP